MPCIQRRIRLKMRSVPCGNGSISRSRTRMWKPTRLLLAPSYHIVTGRSEQSHGADVRKQSAGRANLAPIPQRSTAVRRGHVTINEDWGMAEELGNWKGNYTVHESLVHASGVYAAKWQRTDGGEWVLQAEMFTTLTCTGPEGELCATRSHS